MLIDCHAHLDPFPEAEVAEILERGRAATVEMVVSAGTTLASSRRAVELAQRFPGLFAGVGVHPMDIEAPLDDGAVDELRRLAASTDKVLVISEVGLDFTQGAPDREVQYDAFRRQVRLALEMRLPVVFHSREAHLETLEVLRQEGAHRVGCVMHYFQADEAVAQRALDLGCLLSLARPLLRLPDLQALAARLPLERLVLESDAAPQPFKRRRDRWTEPRHVGEVAATLARLQGRPLDDVARTTTRNFLALLGARGAALAGHMAAAPRAGPAPGPRRPTA